jgi:predicted nucleic acid-binding protein
MNGNKAILDTNVIIFASKKQIDIEKLLNSYDEFYTSIITLMEVYGFDFTNKKEKDLIDEMFGNLGVEEVSIAIAKQVIIYRKNKNKKIKLPDAIILATAKYLGADLITDDWDDFNNIDKDVVVKKLDTFKF